MRHKVAPDSAEAPVVVIQDVHVAGAAARVMHAQRARCTGRALAQRLAAAQTAGRLETGAVALHGGHAEPLYGLIAPAAGDGDFTETVDRYVNGDAHGGRASRGRGALL